MFSALQLAKRNLNSRIYLIFGFLQSLWFIEAVWYFYWAKFLTYSQIGVVFSFLVILGLLAEIPTGHLADKYGRKKSVVGGTSLLFIGAVLMTSAQNALMLIIGVSIMSIGRAFISGALEAIVYDDLKSNNEEGLWDQLCSTKLQVSLIAYIIAVPIGGFLYSINFRLPNLFEALSMFVSIFVAMKLSDVTVATKSLESTVKLKDILTGFRELWGIKLRPYIIPAFMIISIFELYDWGLSKPAMATGFGFDSRGQSIIYTLLAVSNIITIGLMPRLRKIMGDYLGLRFMNIVSAIAFMLSAYSIGYFGIGILWMLETAGNLGDPWTSSVVNNNVESGHRATTLSTMAFLTRVPHLFVNIVAGVSLDSGLIGSFHWWLGIIIILLVMSSFWTHKRPVDK